MTTPIALSADKVAKIYAEGSLRTDVLHDVSFSVRRGETVAIVGASGSGKKHRRLPSGGPGHEASSGEVTVAGQVMSSLSDRARGALRNRALGFVYQFHHLLPEFTALENVCMPLLIRGTPIAEARAQASHLLERGPRRTPGTQARRAERWRTPACGGRPCARHARPACVLGDEPTGNLDERNAAQVYELMLELNREIGTALVLVTHDRSLAARMDRMLELRGGTLQALDPAR